MLEARDLRLVRSIEENRSLVRAARALGTTQPALTRSLAALEARLQGRLFERSRQGVIATDLGRAVLADAADILERLDRLDRRLTEVRGGQRRELTLIAGNYVGETVGHRAAARMLAQVPATRLRLLAGDWADVPRALLAREASLGLLDLRGYAEEPAIEVQRLRPQPGAFLVRNGHPLAGRKAPTLAEIMAFPLIFIARIPIDVQSPLALAREAARRAGAAHPAFPAMIQDSPSVAVGLLPYCDAVLPATFGIARAALRAGAVVALRWREPWVSLHPGVLRLRGRPPGEAEQAYLDLLRDAEREAEEENRAWLAELGLSADCA
jgi:DNA-binding transcriptional LysR family regulator